jgi:hypothetical protein
MLAMRSIVLARQERRGMEAAVDSQQVLSVYPVSPRVKLGGSSGNNKSFSGMHESDGSAEGEQVTNS